jgi:hypothetical protein
MTDVTGGSGERHDFAGDREIAARLVAIDTQLAGQLDPTTKAALVAQREAILADVDEASPIARLFTRTLVGYSSKPGANNAPEPSAQAGPVTEGVAETEAEIVARVESIDTQLSGESDQAIRGALLSELAPLLTNISENTYYRNPRLTNVRNNFALGSYYDVVNIGVNNGK